VAEYDDSEIIVIHFRTQISDKKVEVYAPAQAEELFQEFLKARTLWKMKEAGYEAYVLSRLYGILGRLCKNEMKMQMPEHFANAVSFINGNYANSMLSIDAICKHAGISATNLRLLFRKYYQKTPVEYITELRLEYARSLISCGTSVEQAAEKSGFNDAKYFARVVKKYFHCTPRELRLYGK
jgi:AraC-like DNA-binding protein